MLFEKLEEGDMYKNIEKDDILAARNAFLDGKGSRPNFIITRAKGAKIWDDKGKEYIDCTSGAFVTNIGSCHPKVIEAVKEQIDRLTHSVYDYDNIPMLHLTKKLSHLAPGDLNKINFCLEGSVAVEGAMKLAIKNNPDRRCFVCLDHAYHGRTFATMPLTWAVPGDTLSSHYMSNIVKVPEAYCYRCAFGLNYPSCSLRCASFLEETIENRANGGVIAVLMEPVQGNGGQISFPKEYCSRIREICSRHGVLLIWDEIQTAFGRLGTMFAAELYGVIPDILVFGKALGGGFPIAGIIARDVLKNFGTAEHLFTFAHFPPSMAAALATLQVIEKENLLSKCKQLSDLIMDRLTKAQMKYELIGDVRGVGLAIGIELVEDRRTKEPAVEETQKITQSALEKGVILGISKFAGMGNVIKIKPPLVITESEINKALDVLEECISETSGVVSCDESICSTIISETVF